MTPECFKNRPFIHAAALSTLKGIICLGTVGTPVCQRRWLSSLPSRSQSTWKPPGGFNHHHAKARSIIERSFGSLKTRWRSIFLKALEVQEHILRQMSSPAAQYFHNICVSNGDIMEPAEEGQARRQCGRAAFSTRNSRAGTGSEERIAAAVSAPGCSWWQL